jgi:hypothetical protein
LVIPQFCNGKVYDDVNLLKQNTQQHSPELLINRHLSFAV